MIDNSINNVYTVKLRRIMEAVVKKWGNSLGIRIPSFIARELSLKDGSFVDISEKGKEIIIMPIKKNSLSEMLDKINEQNLHAEIDTGKALGNEIW